MKTFSFGGAVLNVCEISSIGDVYKQELIKSTGKFRWSWMLLQEEYIDAPTEWRFDVRMKNGNHHVFRALSEDEANKARSQCIAALESA